MRNSSSTYDNFRAASHTRHPPEEPVAGGQLKSVQPAVQGFENLRDPVVGGAVQAGREGGEGDPEHDGGHSCVNQNAAHRCNPTGSVGDLKQRESGSGTKILI
jgi:hypothetical protein